MLGLWFLKMQIISYSQQYDLYDKNAYLGDLIFFLCRYHYSMILESLVHSSNASNNQKKLAKSFGELKIVVSATFHWNAANKDVTKHLEKGSSV